MSAQTVETLATTPPVSDVRQFPVKSVPETGKTGPAVEAPAPSDPAQPSPAEAPARKKRSVRSLILPIVALALLSGGAWYGYRYWTDGRFMVSTDDAYVQADMASIAPKISGYVASVPVTENQTVKAGDPLVFMDDGDYKIALAQAEAQIATQGKTLERIAAQTEA